MVRFEDVFEIFLQLKIRDVDFQTTLMEIFEMEIIKMVVFKSQASISSEL